MLVGGSTIAAALATVIGKWVLLSISPLLMNSLMFSIATVVLSFYVLPVRGVRKTFTLTRLGWIWLTAFSVSSWIAILSLWTGIQRMDPSLASFINRIEVPIVIVLGIVLLGERFTRLEWLGAGLSLLGIVVMRLTLRAEYTDGFWWVLFSSVFFGITELLSKVAVRHVDPIALAYIRNMFIAAGYWVVFLWLEGSYAGLQEVWIGVVALGVIAPLLSRMMYLMALTRLALTKVAIISQSQPVFVMLISMFALKQIPALREVTGGVLIVGGCFLMVLTRRRVTKAGLSPQKLRSGT